MWICLVPRAVEPVMFGLPQIGICPVFLAPNQPEVYEDSCKHIVRRKLGSEERATIPWQLSKIFTIVFFSG